MAVSAAAAAPLRENEAAARLDFLELGLAVVDDLLTVDLADDFRFWLTALVEETEPAEEDDEEEEEDAEDEEDEMIEDSVSFCLI